MGTVSRPRGMRPKWHKKRLKRLKRRRRQMRQRSNELRVDLGFGAALMHPRSSGLGIFPRYGGGWMHQFGHIYALQQELLNPAANNWFRATELWHTARHEGVALNVSHFSNLLRQCVVPGAWEQALRILNQMERESIRPDVVCVGSVLAACVEGKKSKETEEVFRAYSKKMFLDSVCYLARIRARVDSGCFAAAIEAGHEQDRCGIPFLPYTYSYLLEAANAADDMAYALTLVRRMRSEQWFLTRQAQLAVQELSGRHGMQHELELLLESGASREEDMSLLMSSNKSSIAKNTLSS